MNLKRRQFLFITASTLLSSFFKKKCLAREDQKNNALYLSAGSDVQGNYFLSGFSYSGIEQFRLPIPGRGHDVAHRPNSKEVAVFARRPGRYVVVADISNGEKITQLESIEGRHFYGHGVYSPDGHWLYASESEYDSGRGVIGVYDVKDSYRLAETLSTYGIGPHEIDLLVDGKTLVVANGGILTHPDTGRLRLNLSGMDSSLAYIDIDSGKLLSAHRLSTELQLMSIRHLAVATDNTVALVMQYQGPRHHLHPLVGFQQGSNPINLSSVPDSIGFRMKNYCSSVAFDSTSKLIAVSSPRGGIITFWSVHENRFLSSLDVIDASGVASGNNPESFIITNGLGNILRHSPLSQKTEILTSTANTLWDNHLLLSGSS